MNGISVLETNYDHWKATPTTDDRRHPAIKSLDNIGHVHLNMHTLYSVLSTPPVLNNHTTYTTIMSVKSPGVYYTMIRQQ